MKKLFMAAAALPLMAAGALAQDLNTETADDCIWSLFNETADALNADLSDGVTITLSFETDDIVNYCEELTGDETEFFNGISSFSTTIGAVTFNLD